MIRTIILIILSFQETEIIGEMSVSKKNFGVLDQKTMKWILDNQNSKKMSVTIIPFFQRRKLRRSKSNLPKVTQLSQNLNPGRPKC
jgi:hypothetical protein